MRVILLTYYLNYDASFQEVRFGLQDCWLSMAELAVKRSGDRSRANGVSFRIS